MEPVAEPVSPIHADLVCHQSQRLYFFHVYGLRDFKICLCVSATFDPKTIKPVFTALGHRSSHQFQVN